MLKSEIDRLRDEIAMSALTGLAAANSLPQQAEALMNVQQKTGSHVCTITARLAYNYADAMLEERKKYAKA